MRLKGFIHIKGVFGLVLGLLFLFHSPSFSQSTETANADTEQVATESSADASATTTETEASSNQEVSASSSSSVADASASVEEGTSIPTQVYVNFFYYVLLFVLVCFIVTILGQILSVYELTQGLLKRKSANEWNSHQAWFFLVGLFVFLYGIYWSYTHHGAQSYREAATIHGAKIDTLFIITTIIITTGKYYRRK